MLGNNICKLYHDYFESIKQMQIFFLSISGLSLMLTAWFQHNTVTVVSNYNSFSGGYMLNYCGSYVNEETNYFAGTF